MGPGSEANEEEITMAYQLGLKLAKEGYCILTGGRNCGVMHAALKGAKASAGLTIGILPKKDSQIISEFVDIPIFTDLGNARNNINTLSSNVVLAIGNGPGTLSEMALSLKNKVPLVVINTDENLKAYLESLNHNSMLFFSTNINEIITFINKLLRPANLH